MIRFPSLGYLFDRVKVDVNDDNSVEVFVEYIQIAAPSIFGAALDPTGFSSKEDQASFFKVIIEEKFLCRIGEGARFFF
eukprot:CAMPEP_0196654508 /NCGR_PEP_ID=MMETSP1086-20130531/4224_1 /TAXON_ID=77921 /ORGANISM="Cyanoptyche  gloeocystis , Strain SAG4.97" /LENGTH=78 /DNA_ID=CAMNT_0041986315 /DNA_START=177 /DNA_END=413 /DNA_ORIENTATION=+